MSNIKIKTTQLESLIFPSNLSNVKNINGIDFNTYFNSNASGIEYYQYRNCTNTPNTTNTGLLEIYVNETHTVITMDVIDFSMGKLWTRYLKNGSWSVWKEIKFL